jgi:Tfp pilus assembly protein PilO
MTGRDRFVLMAIVVLAVLGAGWMLVVSPERKKADEQSTQLAAAQTQLDSAEGQLANAKAAQSQYAAAYASVVSLGKAVPPGQEVSSLIYELSHTSSSKNVDFSSIVSNAGGPAGSASPAGATAVAAGFTQMPFTFVFNGSFFDLERLFNSLDGFTTRASNGALRVSGRLLTVQSVKLAPSGEPTATSSSSQLVGTINATAYQLPGGQAVTGSATPTSPTGAAPATGTAATSPTAPAIVRVNP